MASSMSATPSAWSGARRTSRRRLRRWSSSTSPWTRPRWAIASGSRWGSAPASTTACTSSRRTEVRSYRRGTTHASKRLVIVDVSIHIRSTLGSGACRRMLACMLKLARLSRPLRSSIALALAALVTLALSASTASATRAEKPYTPHIDPADFVAKVDNPYFPLPPGARWTYRGKTPDGIERDVVEVTSQTKVIRGVRCVVVHDTVSIGGQVTEDTFDWYAQDRTGNVWYFGEDTKEFETLEPSLVEHKYYARGVGVVLEVTVKGGSERVELIEYTTP